MQKNGAELTGSDMARWLGMSQADKRKELTSKPLPEITVTQEMRQEAFDNWETTDDHGMQISISGMDGEDGLFAGGRWKSSFD